MAGSFFTTVGDAAMAVPVETEPHIQTWKARQFFFEEPISLSRNGLDMADFTYWDISPDGKRFLMMKESRHAEAPRKINIVVNWFEELKQKVPAK